MARAVQRALKSAALSATGSQKQVATTGRRSGYLAQAEVGDIGRIERTSMAGKPIEALKRSEHVRKQRQEKEARARARSMLY